MDDVHLVRGVDRSGDRLEQPRGFVRSQGALLEAVGQAAAFTILHAEVRLPLKLADFENLHDVRMLQASQGVGLVAETREVFGVARHVLQDFQRHQLIGCRVRSQVHRGHAATA